MSVKKIRYETPKLISLNLPAKYGQGFEIESICHDGSFAGSSGCQSGTLPSIISDDCTSGSLASDYCTNGDYPGIGGAACSNGDTDYS